MHDCVAVDTKKKAFVCSLLMYASFPIAFLAILIGWLIHPESEDQREPLSFLLCLPLSPMFVLRGFLLLSSDEVRRAVASREPFPVYPPPTKTGAVAWIVAGLLFGGLAVSGAFNTLA